MSYVTYEFAIFAKVTTILCAVSSVSIVLYHLITECKASKDSQKTKLKSKILNFLLKFCIIVAALFNVNGCFQHFGINTSNGIIHGSCYMLYTVQLIIYGMIKTGIYFSYFLRLDVSFGGSAFVVNKCLLRILYILTSLYFLGYILGVPFDDKRDYEWNYKYNICQSRDSNFQSLEGLVLTIAVIMYEVIISTTTLILFLKPLFYLNRLQNDKNLHNLIIKVALLNSIMIISSILLLVLYSIIHLHYN